MVDFIFLKFGKSYVFYCFQDKNGVFMQNQNYNEGKRYLLESNENYVFSNIFFKTTQEKFVLFTKAYGGTEFDLQILQNPNQFINQINEKTYFATKDMCIIENSMLTRRWEHTEIGIKVLKRFKIEIRDEKPIQIYFPNIPNFKIKNIFWYDRSYLGLIYNTPTDELNFLIAISKTTFKIYELKPSPETGKTIAVEINEEYYKALQVTNTRFRSKDDLVSERKLEELIYKGDPIPANEIQTQKCAMF
jgi:hypothetical protein